jgi:protein MPE1
MKDDNHQIARSSSLVVRRRPAVMKGRGTAQNYIIGTDSASALTGDHRIEAHAREAMKEKMFGRGARGATGGAFGSMTKRFDGKEDKAVSGRLSRERKSCTNALQPQVKVTTGDADEDAKIAAMLQMQSETWEDMALDMST